MNLLPEFLQDTRFLKLIDNLRVKEQTVKVTILDWTELPIELVTGRVISGSMNLTADSNMRRTATLSIFAEEGNNNLENIDSLFAINKKCMLEMGIKNTVPKYKYNRENKTTKIMETVLLDYQKMYGLTIWFPLGLYVMFNPSISHSMTGVTISMNLKDKMCLLNGDLGGVIHSSVDFMYMDLTVDAAGSVKSNTATLIYDIIKELVHHWGNEDLAKVVISDVPLKIKSAMSWLGSTSVWLLQNTLGLAAEIYLDLTDALARYEEINLARILDPSLPVLELVLITPGQEMGFVYLHFTYPAKELVCNAGLTVTSVLDKIVNTLGNFEYFYDVMGNFIFQLKQNYLNTSNVAYWNQHKEELTYPGLMPHDVYEADVYRMSKNSYDFTYNEFTIGFNNTLSYNNIKNDFVVWGARKNSAGVLTPCRYHLAIDRKPELNEHTFVLYEDGLGVVRGAGWKPTWNGRSDELLIGLELFPYAEEEEYKGRIIDVIHQRMSIDWREEIYYQMLEDLVLGTGTSTERNNSYFQYYAELKEEFPKIFDLRRRTSDQRIEEIQDNITFFTTVLDELSNDLAYDDVRLIYLNTIESLNNLLNYYLLLKSIIGTINSTDLRWQEYYQAMGWTDMMINHPDQINYYLDFIDELTLIGKYSVGNIGRRAKIVVDNQNSNCVFEPEIPDIVYIDNTSDTYDEDKEVCRQIGQTWVQVDNYLRDFLYQSGRKSSCYLKIKDLLYQFTHITNTISITTLPIYHLEPGMRVTIEDEASSITGDFIIQSMSLPLDINSTMNINCYEAEQKI